MKPFVWNENMSVEETKDGAYWERNMLALLLAKRMNNAIHGSNLQTPGANGGYVCGWFPHQGDPYEGWSRVISLDCGRISFHVPDSFDLGDLPEIKPNWDGHSTEQKWTRIMEICGIV